MKTLLEPGERPQVEALADMWRRERLANADSIEDNAATLKALNEIGMALSAERDPARLLDLILSRARHLVAADAGSLYLVEKAICSGAIGLGALADRAHKVLELDAMPLARNGARVSRSAA